MRSFNNELDNESCKERLQASSSLVTPLHCGSTMF